MKTLIKNIKEIVTVSKNSKIKKGNEMSKLNSLKDAWILIEKDKIYDFGSKKDLFKIKQQKINRTIDAENGMVLPCWCDSHTHIVFAGSREKEVLTTGTSDSGTESEIQEQEITEEKFVSAIERPSELFGVTRRVYTGRGNLYVTVNRTEEGKPFEIFAALGKAGGNDSAMAEAVSRMVSLTLRSGIDPKETIEQLKGITDVPAWNEGELIRSVPDAIANVLEKIYESQNESQLSIPDINKSAVLSDIQNNNDISNTKMDEVLKSEICPECPSALAFEEGCQKCYSCGYSKC